MSMDSDNRLRQASSWNAAYLSSAAAESLPDPDHVDADAAVRESEVGVDVNGIVLDECNYSPTLRSIYDQLLLQGKMALFTRSLRQRQRRSC